MHRHGIKTYSSVNIGEVKISFKTFMEVDAVHNLNNTNYRNIHH